MTGTTRSFSRSAPALLAWASLLVYLPVCLGLTTDLLDAARGGGDLAPCGCDGDCCCGAPCCAPTVESCCEPAPVSSCCDETAPACLETPPVEARYRWDVACTCGLDDARDRALLASGDVHVPPARAVGPTDPDPDRRNRLDAPARPTRPLEPPDPVPKSLLLV